jgi:hypothetical protein
MRRRRRSWLGGSLAGLVALAGCCPDEHSIQFSREVLYLPRSEARDLDAWRRQAGVSSREEYVELSVRHYVELMDELRREHPAAYQCELTLLRYGGVPRRCEALMNKIVEEWK